ncbi:MAG: hypothetical protein H7Z38_01555 [Rubrivivax sp.]|nr:hypothetical protein [Pyrinomonadaceae bacterium]
MGNENDIDLSAKLQQFILRAIGMGLDNLRKLGSLTPMMLSSRDDELNLGVLAVEGDELMRVAADVVSELPSDTDFYALLFDGKMNVDGILLSAVIVQAGERNGGQGHMVYQQYEPETYKSVGTPEYAGRIEHLPSR